MSRTVHEAVIVEHELWMAEYGRIYLNKDVKDRRFKIFKENLESMVRTSSNEGNKTYRLRIIEYPDLTHVDFVASRSGYLKLGRAVTSPNTSFIYAEFTEVPTSLDWKERGAVTPVKNQGSCGKT